jgi:hypothetical protein
VNSGWRWAPWLLACLTHFDKEPTKRVAVLRSLIVIMMMEVVVITTRMLLMMMVVVVMGWEGMRKMNVWNTRKGVGMAALSNTLAIYGNAVRMIYMHSMNVQYVCSMYVWQRCTHDIYAQYECTV